MPSGTVSGNLLFVNYADTEGNPQTAWPGDEIDVLDDAEYDRIARYGGFEGTERQPQYVGTDATAYVDERDPEDTSPEAAVPAENGGVWPLDDAGGSDYGSMTKAELEELADSRELEVEGTGANGAVTKQDLIDALEADDRA